MAATIFSAIAILYVGVSMAVDPAAFVRTFRLLAWALESLEHRLRGEWRVASLRPPEPEPLPAGQVLALKLGGAALCLCGLLLPALGALVLP